MRSLPQLLIAYKASFWLALIIWALAATMMHPTFASILAECMIGCLLMVLRWAAHKEGRYGR